MQLHSSFVNPAIVPSLSSPASRASSARTSASLREGPGGSATAARVKGAAAGARRGTTTPPTRRPTIVERDAKARTARRDARDPARNERALAGIADEDVADMIPGNARAMRARVRWHGARLGFAARRESLLRFIFRVAPDHECSRVVG